MIENVYFREEKYDVTTSVGHWPAPAYQVCKGLDITMFL